MKSISANSTSDPGAVPAATEAAVFALGWTTQQARELGEDAAVVLLMRDADGVLRPQGRAPADWQPTEPVREAVTAAADRGKPAVRGAGEARMAIAVVVRMGEVVAVAAAEISVSDETDTANALRRLQWGAAGVEAHLRRSEMTALPQVSAAPVDDGALRALRVLVRALQARGYRDAARNAATELAGKIGAERVAIARRRGRSARVEAISHAADFKGRTHALDLLTASAEEVLDQRDALIWPPEEGAAPLTRRALEELARETGHGAVVALPIGSIETPWGVVVAEFATPEQAVQALPRLDVAGDALALLLETKRRDDRFWVMRAVEGSAHALRGLLGPRALGWKLAALVLIGVIAAGSTVMAPARVTADAEITSQGRVIVSAPFDGFLAERLVRAGDAVATGALLLRLDDRDLQLDLLRQEASRRQKVIEQDSAVAANDRAQLSVLRAEIAEIDAQIALTRAQIAAGQMRAPFNATVTLDTTEGKVGAPLGRGEELLALAPLERRSLTLYIPDAGIDRIAIGQTGTLRLSAMPERPLDFAVTHLTPLTAPRDGANTFRAEAELTGDVPPDLGLGMEGVAKIVTGRDLWVLTWGKPFVEALRLRLWSLWP